MKTVSWMVAGLARSMYVIAGVALAASMLLTVADVILRMFRRPIVGTYELVGLLGAVVIGFAIPQTSRLKGHVMMDFFTGALGKFWGKCFHAMTRLLAIGVFVIIGWNLIGVGNDFRRVGEVTPTLLLPLFPVPYGIAVCCLIECLVLSLEIFEGGEDLT